ncbi:MAG: hypothetical protein ACJ8GN_01990 [Longimicrobiaceae bacterium]
MGGAWGLIKVDLTSSFKIADQDLTAVRYLNEPEAVEIRANTYGGENAKISLCVLLSPAEAEQLAADLVARAARARELLEQKKAAAYDAGPEVR